MDSKHCEHGNNKLDILFHPLVAYLLAALSGVMFTISNFLVQVTIDQNPSTKIPTLEIVFARVAVQLIVISPVMVIRRTSVLVEKKDICSLICMALAGYFNIVFTYLSLDKIPISDTLVITFTSPFFCAIFSQVILKERCRWFDIACGCVSFIGVLIVARPDFLFGSNQSPKTVLFQRRKLPRSKYEFVYLLGVFYALLGGTCLALYFVLTRKFANKNSQLLTIFFPSLFGSILSPLIMVLQQHKFVFPSSIVSQISIVSVGLTSLVALCFLTLSLRLENATTVNLIRNVDVLYAFLLQYFAMGIKPTIWNIAGGILIIAATTVMTLKRWFSNTFYKPIPQADTVDENEN